MELYEIGLCYKESADKIEEKIQKLKQEDTQKQDRHIQYMIEYYRQRKRELLELYELCSKYYQKGYYRNAKYSFNEDIRVVKVLSDGAIYTRRGTRRCKGTKTEKEPPKSDQSGTYRKATASDIDVLFRRKKDDSDIKRTRS